MPRALSSWELSSTESSVASAIITGTWMTRISRVFLSALAKAGSMINRPQLKVGLKVQG